MVKLQLYSNDRQIATDEGRFTEWRHRACASATHLVAVERMLMGGRDQAKNEGERHGWKSQR